MDIASVDSCSSLFSPFRSFSDRRHRRRPMDLDPDLVHPDAAQETRLTGVKDRPPRSASYYS